MLVLVINSGSSSLKYQVRDATSGQRLLEGLIEKIGDTAHGHPADHATAIDVVFRELERTLGERPIDAVGHRVVHGGERFGEPELVNYEITRAIERLNPLAPLHNPAQRRWASARSCEQWPNMPQVAVFDTAFHRTLPEHAWRYAVPDSLYTDTGSAATASTAPRHEYVATGPRGCWTSGRRSSTPSSPTWATEPRSRRSAEASPSTPPWASPRWRAWSWVPAPGTWTRRSSRS